jgi:signal transduction histidine kinase
MPPEKALVDLNQVVRDGLYFLESRCSKAGIEVVRKLDSDLPEIYADASQVHQVLVNLVVNAIQAMHEGGRVTIETRGGNDSAILVVSDTGCGMTDAVRQNILRKRTFRSVYVIWEIPLSIIPVIRESSKK